MVTIIQQFLSINNFQLAWQKVANNRGGAGIDEETIADFAHKIETNLLQLKDAVANNTYLPSPYKQIRIPKSKGKWRELKIPTVRDRIVQQALLNVLYPLVETRFSSASFAYRPNISYLAAVEKVAYWRDQGYTWVLDADIVQYFDNIDQQILLAETRKYIDHPGILWLIKSWLSAGIVTEFGLVSLPKGIPQGAVISPLLANVYLDKFDQTISASDLQLVRYADDFLVLATTKKRIIQAYSEVTRLLKPRGLSLHAQKTQITNFERGFRFLGHGFLEQAIFPVNKPKNQSSHITTKKKTSYFQKKQNKKKATSSSPKKVLATLFSNKCQLNQQNNIWNLEMATLYLLEQGTSVYKDYQRFIIHVPKKEKLEVPIKEVEKVLLFGNVQLSTPVINVCLQTPIAVLFLSPSGQYRGHLWSIDFLNFNLELNQFKTWANSLFQLKVSRSIVRGKLINSKQLLMRLNRKRKLASVKKVIAGIDSDLQAVEVADNLDTLRGYEGASAARYFPALGQLITNSEFPFALRHRQPPTDPVNSLLSFGYTLLYSNVLSLILAEGLSPYFGNFHYGEKKKPYLAFDLMEEFRSPIVDSLVLKLINQSSFKRNDFEFLAHNEGVYLTDAARRLFLNYFESRMNEKVSHRDLKSPVSYREIIQLQIRRYRRSLLSSTLYQPFLRST